MKDGKTRKGRTGQSGVGKKEEGEGKGGGRIKERKGDRYSV
jgi:hypothetical protein